MDAIQRTLTGSSLEVLIDGVLAISMFAVMAIYNLRLTFVVLLVAVLYALLRWALFRPMREAVNEQLVFAAQQQTHFIEPARHSGDQAAHGRSRPPVALAERRGGHAQRQHPRADAHADLQDGELRLVRTGKRADRLAGRARGDGGGFSVGMLLAFFAYKLVFVSRLSNLIDKFTEFRLLDLHAERVADVALAAGEQRGQAVAPDLSKATWVVENLGFRYGPHDPFIFRNVSFTVDPGDSVALTGRSGAGKTTLAKVGWSAAGDRGASADRRPRHPRHRPDLLRTQLAAVMQEDYVFAGSITDNVSLFDPDADEARVAESLQAAALWDEVSRMPMGVDSLVGNTGSALSGGQRQRLLLARALYRKPKFLLLDEATSALDNEREQAVNQSVRNLGITSLIIAHRDSTVATAGKRVGL
jgi:ATP-binding cassette subfamily B protein RaxB